MSFFTILFLALLCSSVMGSHAAEALLVYSQKESQLYWDHPKYIFSHFNLFLQFHVCMLIKSKKNVNIYVAVFAFLKP